MGRWVNVALAGAGALTAVALVELATTDPVILVESFAFDVPASTRAIDRWVAADQAAHHVLVTPWASDVSVDDPWEPRRMPGAMAARSRFPPFDWGSCEVQFHYEPEDTGTSQVTFLRRCALRPTVALVTSVYRKVAPRSAVPFEEQVARLEKQALPSLR